MEEKNLENQDSQNLENEENLESESQDNDSGEAESVETLKSKNQSLYEQLQKAKGKIRDEDGKWVKKPEAKQEREESRAKSNDIGYAEKAFLLSSDLKIKGEKEINLVKTYMKETGRDIDSIIESKYFQNELNDLREIERTSNATIKGKDGKGISTDSVEYWMTKDFKDVPKDMRAKVIDAQIKKEKNKNIFYNS